MSHRETSSVFPSSSVTVVVVNHSAGTTTSTSWSAPVKAHRSLASIQPTPARMTEEAITTTTHRSSAKNGLVRFFFAFFFPLPPDGRLGWDGSPAACRRTWPPSQLVVW